MDSKIKLDCIEDNCNYVTQELPFHQAEKLLNMHLDHKHPQRAFTMQVDVPQPYHQPQPQAVVQQCQPQAVAQQPQHQHQVIVQQHQQVVRELFLQLSGLPLAMTSDNIERSLQSMGFHQVEIALVETEASKSSGTAIVKVNYEADFNNILYSGKLQNAFRNSGVSAQVASRAAFVRYRKLKSNETRHLRLKGMVWEAKEADVRSFLRDCRVKEVTMGKTPLGSPNGEALVELESAADTSKAMAHNRKNLTVGGKSRFVVIEPVSEEVFKMEKLSLEIKEPPMKRIKTDAPEVKELESYVKVSNFPKGITEAHVKHFFESNDCKPETIYMMRNSQNSLTNVYVKFADRKAALRGVSCHSSCLVKYRVNIDLLSRIEKSTDILHKFLEIERKQDECKFHNERVKNQCQALNRDPTSDLQCNTKLLPISANQLKKLFSKEQIKKLEEEKKQRNLLINEGPQCVRLSLNDLQEIHKNKSEEWKRIQTFFSVPTFEKKITDHEIEREWKRFSDMHKEGKFQIDQKEKKSPKKDKVPKPNQTYKQFLKKLTDKTELDLRDKIVKTLGGQKGLLIRSVDYQKIIKKESYEALRELGLQIPAFNCPNPATCTKHEENCYQAESDLMLFYARKDVLCVRIIEVKRQQSFPWDEKIRPTDESMQKCLEQQVKGYLFIMAFLLDVPWYKIDVKLFSAFPEADCSNICCTDCKSYIIDKNDMEKSQLEFFEKLQLKSNKYDDISSPDHPLLKISSRLFGLYSILHQNNKTFDDHHKMASEAIRNTVEEHDKKLSDEKFIFLNNDQRDILAADLNDLNVTFTGGSGTGKTEMAKALVKNIVDQTNKEGNEALHIYIVTCLMNKKAALLQKFQSDFKKFENVKTLEIETLGDFIDKRGLNRHDWKTADGYGYRLPELIGEIIRKLGERHLSERFIIFVDEIMAFGNREALNWENLEIPPALTANIFLAFSPVNINKGNIMKIVKDDDEKPSDMNDSTKEYLILPIKENGFRHCGLTLRYRNSKSLQTFSKHVAKEMTGKYVILNEIPAVDIEGELPIWYDVGDVADANDANFEKTLKCIDKLLIERRIKGEQIVVLLDRDLVERGGGGPFVEKCKKVLGQRRKDLRVMEERLFHGMESNTVVYVGAGHMEALTRAQLNLYIVTLKTKNNPNTSWYGRYTGAFVSAVYNRCLTKLNY